MGTKKKLDLKALEKKLIKKTITDPYWGTSRYDSVNIGDKN